MRQRFVHLLAIFLCWLCIFESVSIALPSAIPTNDTCHGIFSYFENHHRISPALIRSIVYYLEELESRFEKLRALESAISHGQFWQRFFNSNKNQILLAALKQYDELRLLTKRYQEDEKLFDEAVRQREVDVANMIKASMAEKVPVIERATEKLISKLGELDPVTDEVIIEIKPSSGHRYDAPQILTYRIYQMYLRYFEQQNWSVEIEHIEGEGQKIKEVVLKVSGIGAYRHLRHESGHMRIEAAINGSNKDNKIHTYGVSITVLPINTPLAMVWNEADFEIETMRSGGPGGQHVNKTESAVRITHKPSGISVRVEGERSQKRNISLAMELIKARILALKTAVAAKQSRDHRRAQIGLIGASLQSTSIRTYDLTRGEVRDTRLENTTFNLKEVEKGKDELRTMIELLELRRLEQMLDDMFSTENFFNSLPQ